MNTIHPDEFEQSLRRLKPGSMTTTDADLIYRCGWEAATAALEEPAQPRAVRTSSMSPKLNFGGGAALGLAMGVLSMLWIGLSPPPNGDTPQLAQQIGSSPLNHDSQTVANEEGAAEQQLDLAKELASLQNVIDQLVAQVQLQNSFQAELEQAILEEPAQSRFDGTSVLSQAALRSWGEAFVSTNKQPGRPHGESPSPPTNRQTPSFGELLFGSEQSEIY